MDMDEPGTAYSRFPKLARARDGRVALAWDDDRSGFEAIYLRVRGTGERPEWGPEVLVSTAGPKRAARLPDAGGPEGAVRWPYDVGATSFGCLTQPFFRGTLCPWDASASTT